MHSNLRRNGLMTSSAGVGTLAGIMLPHEIAVVLVICLMVASVVTVFLWSKAGQPY
jgi:p-aminobenzoyl-glutamate transporter AbgT